MRRPKAILTLLALLMQCGVLFGQQYRILPRELLDSVANPVAAADSPMQFEQTHLDAGTIGEDDPPSEYRYRWRNGGDTPLVITGVKTSCACAVVRYDKQPVEPGGEATISVIYHPKGHPGGFNRKISVYTQHDVRPSAVLELSGTVAPSRLPIREYRYAFGPLRLKQTQVRMEGTARCMERIEVLNAGDTPLRIAADTVALPEYLRVRCEPEQIAPGARADLEIRFDPARAAEPLPERIAVVLNGIDLPPEARTLGVRFGGAEE